MRLQWKLLAAAAGLATTLLAAPAAMADVIYTLNVDNCTSGCLNGGTGGSVTLHSNGTGSVTVTVSLSGVDFHHTNAFDAFAFNLSGISSLSTFTVSSSDFQALSTSAGTLHEDGAGNFMYAVDFKNGVANFSGDTSLVFTVTATGLSTSSFALASNQGDYFAAAVYNAANTTCTGVIASNGGTTPTLGGSNTGTGTCDSATTTGDAPPPVPEPATLAVFGTGLIMLAVTFGRRRRPWRRG